MALNNKFNDFEKQYGEYQDAGVVNGGSRTLGKGMEEQYEEQVDEYGRV